MAFSSSDSDGVADFSMGRVNLEWDKPFALSLSFDKLRMIGRKGFDKLSPNGVWRG
jgi:hypothetical protein